MVPHSRASTYGNGVVLMSSKTAFHARLGHAHLKVRDLERAVAFYSNALGLEVTEIVDDRYAFLTDGVMHHAIALQRVGEHAQTPRRQDTGLYHIAFEVPDKSSFARALLRLHEAGVSVGTVDHLISWAMYFTDPDGNGLEIYVDTRTSEGGQAFWRGVNTPIEHQELQEFVGRAMVET
jgi:catechol 2,3-dioxygenase